MTDYKEKYQEAKKLISEQKKVIKKQDKFIEKLCLKLADKNKKVQLHDKQSLKQALQELKAQNLSLEMKIQYLPDKDKYIKLIG